jgi:hypothetical protein
MHHTEPTTGAPSRRRRVSAGVVRWLSAIAFAGVILSCGASGAPGAALEGVPHGAVASIDPELEARIADELEGVQLEVWGGGRASPGRTTSMFFHHGDWAAQTYFTTDGWCLSRTYSWKVLGAESEQTFRLEYTVVEEFPDCAMPFGDELSFHVHSRSREWLDGEYVTPYDHGAQRTVCAEVWDDPIPCGFADAAALVADLDV